MTYTISTEPVTREHIGREVLAVNKGGTMECCTLKEISWPYYDPVYIVEGAICTAYDVVLLIIDDSQL